MPSASFSVTTDRAPEDVFAYLADLQNTTTWMSSFVDEVELISGHRPGTVGARFLVTHTRALFDDVTVDYETIEAQSPSLLVFATKHPKLTGTDTYRLAPADDGGTTIEYTTEFAYTGLNKLATPLGAAVIKAVTGGVGTELQKALGDR
jgi:uncharacterized protein YndB with AHSA1/START domain